MKNIPFIYESPQLIEQYMLMHWGQDHEIFNPNLFPQVPQIQSLPLRCAELAKMYASEFTSALDLGCAVGRSTFELARDFKQVEGIDYSQAFINCAMELQKNGELSYVCKTVGDETQALTAIVDKTINRSRVQFAVGDACKLENSLGKFDAVILANVICRLHNPALCLQRMREFIKPNGVLVLTTPYSWFTEYTPKQNWLKNTGDVIAALPEFSLIHEENIPFVIREHRRKFEFIVTHGLVFRKI